jgi:hypothetical protein
MIRRPKSVYDFLFFTDFLVSFILYECFLLFYHIFSGATRLVRLPV